MYGFRRGSGGAGGAGNVSTLSGGANGRITLWNGATTVTGDPSGTWSGTGHTFVLGSPTFNASDGHFTGPAGASFGPSAVGGGFTNQPAGDTIDLVSDDAGDTTQQVTIIGTLAGVDASENIMLNGVVPVTSAGTYDLILALVLNGACVGTVTASETSGGLAITTIAPAALSAGLQTFAAIDGYGKVLQIVASGATTKTVGIGGYALGGGIQREPVVLTGTTKVNTMNTWEGAVQFYLGDLEATRTVTLNSIAGFDFKSTGGVSLPIETGTVNGLTVSANPAMSNVLLRASSVGYVAAGNANSVYIGFGAGQATTGTNGGDSVGIGSRALLSNTTGNDHTAVGMSALQSNTTGHRNTAIGNIALLSNTIGDDNVAVGWDCLTNNTGGYGNVAIGNKAAKNTNSADGSVAYRNVAVGFEALLSNVTGYGNVAVGFEAGYYSTGNNNLFIGYGAGIDVGITGSNNVMLGNLASPSSVTVSNEITIGNSSITAFRVPGLALTAGTMTVERNSDMRSITSSYAWTNAMVVALGASLTGDIKVATLPAKTQVIDAALVITGAGAGTTTLTASLGRTGAAYLDYIVASDAQAAANTVYGDASGERGTNLTGYDLPSYTGTTDVYVHFVSTVANLDQVTGSTGRVILTTRLMP